MKPFVLSVYFQVIYRNLKPVQFSWFLIVIQQRLIMFKDIIIILYQLNVGTKTIHLSHRSRARCTIKRPTNVNLKTKEQNIGNTSIDYFKQPINFLNDKTYLQVTIHIDIMISTVANKNDNFNDVIYSA